MTRWHWLHEAWHPAACSLLCIPGLQADVSASDCSRGPESTDIRQPRWQERPWEGPEDRLRPGVVTLWLAAGHCSGHTTLALSCSTQSLACRQLTIKCNIDISQFHMSLEQERFYVKLSIHSNTHTRQYPHMSQLSQLPITLLLYELQESAWFKASLRISDVEEEGVAEQKCLWLYPIETIQYHIRQYSDAGFLEIAK